ncbi:ABC transporter permease [Arachidicoccus terrestris]|uniref:ABC transporter permease n=1 Tax=Arachidicoccus terrestris TaxID=2875539 RepID=UPI001CC3F99F|nr:ABC transporter permease [Arachidicoccus terrestris]UAY56814.1 ABC transporter permease [Arachidicoccus terrestris]
MLRMYLKTAIRSLQRNKLFSGLNVFGLAVGMAGAILIAILLQYMLSYDRFHKDEDQLYVISNLDHFNGELHAWKTTPTILGPSIKEAMPEIQAFTRVDIGYSYLFSVGEHRIQTDKGGYVDPGFFSMFSFPMLSGAVNDDWKSGSGIIISASFAKAMFGNENAVGKTLRLDTTSYFKVAGVLRDMPKNTKFKADFFLSWQYADRQGQLDSNWENNSVNTYIKLNEGTDLTAFNKKIEGFTRLHNRKIKTTIFAVPLKEDYLYNQEENGQYASGRIVIVRCLTVIGILLLLIACINFMNLSTAQSERRAREVGVRKVIGATRTRLIVQFLVESVLLAFFAFIIAVGIVKLLLPAFGNLVETKLSWHFGIGGWIIAVAVMILTGLIAGSYPAFYLSSFAPIKVLKGTLGRIGRKVSARSVLVVLQFTVAIILILTTIMITQDTGYVQNRDSGYDRNGLLYTNLEGHLNKNYEPLRNALLKSGAVTSVSKNMSPVTQRYTDSWGFSWPGSTEQDKKIDFIRYGTNADMVGTLGMHLLEGRDIDVYKYPADSTAAMLTETSVRTMRLKDPIGAVIRRNDVTWHVVGVIQDFIIEQPFDKVAPMIILGPAAYLQTIHYRLNPNRPVEANLAAIKGIFNQFNPDYPFVYHFVDNTYAEKFKENKKFGQLSLLFAGLTIFISCLGLFGLITYMAETRTKEIGVRKVLGASVAAIIGLLSKGFVRLILISFVIAIPIALLIMDKWLSSSVYSIGIQWWWFVVTVLIAILIGFLTVSFQALKAARANPVQSLKTE